MSAPPTAPWLLIVVDGGVAAVLPDGRTTFQGAFPLPCAA